MAWNRRSTAGRRDQHVEDVLVVPRLPLVQQLFRPAVGRVLDEDLRSDGGRGGDGHGVHELPI